MTKQTDESELWKLGPEWRVSTIRDSRDQIEIRYGHVPVETLATDRFAVLANGRTEFIEKYSYVAQDLQLPQNCGFLTWDHRGQGASGGARSWVASYDDYGLDAEKVISQVCGAKSHVVIAHSMGGLIALYATMKGYIKPKALILCSPLFGLPNLPVPRVLAKPTSKFFSHLRLGTMASGAGNHIKRPFALNNLTHSVERYSRMQETPWKCGSATFGWVDQTFEALAHVFDPSNLEKLRVPVLVIGGTAESVVDPDAFQRWIQLASRWSSAETELLLIPDARHELLSEIPKYYDRTISTIRRWLNTHLIGQQISKS